MSTFSDIKSDIRENLNDSGVTYYSAADMTESLEDGYTDVLFRTRCLIKKVTLSFIASPYYDFKLLGVEDFMCVIAIFNNNTNQWLFDDVTVRDLDSIRTDWELAEGQPECWVPLNFELNVIWPYISVPTGDFDLYYAAKAANIDDYTDTPLIASYCQNLLEWYSTGDLLEQAEEYNKASAYFKSYEEDLESYFLRVKQLAKRDILLKI
jgi:hypothetical protein